MRILIHADGGARRGMGHLMRSVALAEEAGRRGHEVSWCGRWDESAAATLLRFGHHPDRLHRLAPDGLESSPVSLVAELAPDVLHIDSYDLAPTRERWAAGLVSATQDHPHGRRPADLVIDPNLGAQQRLATQPPEARWVLPGLDYVALRSAVRFARPRVPIAPTDVRRVLVVMGGTDAWGLSARVVTELAGAVRGREVTVVAPQAQHEAVRAAAGPHRVAVVPFTDELAALAVEQDLVVTAAGSSVWELCHLGVPMGVLCVSDNQEPGYEAVVATGAAIGLGRSADLGSGRVRRALSGVLDDPGPLRTAADRAFELVDGRGAWRTVSAWESAGRVVADRPTASTAVRLRDATRDDADLLLAWRNDPVTRQWSRSSAPVDRDTHQEWLRHTLTRPDRHLWLALSPDPIAVVRWDQRLGDHWEISITVAPHARGQHRAGAILEAAHAQLVATLRRVPVVLATIHDDNRASRGLFAGAGYLPFAPPDAQGFGQYARWPVRSGPTSAPSHGGRHA
ncbi:bifunctional UDP-2,4-diacetamido-2,4,6-trideoxy-beta-L-altropyranose hydrolase/GNAT family N-acetyltransferase [Nocardioides nitrophenolicus]|uniref:bifunctional UDP-2,4-diacetamido-2,4,6-trideoxy-beta-L-altropyranose hydrolase/GNAT family N-acetyltransferase n=1 Tax=Nocardioides nitrophenolicus TaxID=60489 RepID=UPI00195DB240|nr:bifunctional UDP-2,4-diacetamido-2,4,6-trideoxy-beta-L-altropyranose hydrolase/GNAT family N-acetyltransferase [Nocardioides nitrophenolicus]MBM7518709.1 spore coat polysaccharide biosynthesis predicted glycosyltransferase SpsG/RimJ/RimL family protein N-acetyltransferase [Nocardioides nitrophenolicus]